MISLAEVKKAAQKMRGVVVRTPLLSATPIGSELGVNLFLKLENLQITNAFKVRGPLNRLSSLPRGAKVIAPSTGNHAQGVAFAAKRYGLRAYVVMPKSTPAVKVNGVKRHKGQVIFVDGVYDDAFDFAKRLAAKEGMTFVSSFNDEEMIAGQGTVGLEMLEDNSDIDMLIAPIGGGGLVAGVGVVTKSLRPDIKLIGVQAKGAAAMKVSIDKGEVVQLRNIGTIADGIAIKRPGEINFDYVKRLVDSIELVTDRQIEQAIKILFNQLKCVAEPAGAASLAALIKMVKSGKVPKGRKVACIISGGNIDTDLLFKILKS